jgi:O-antigen/teichoic acid export membrane protein
VNETPIAQRTNDARADLSALRARLLGDTLRYAPAVIVPAATSVVGVALFTRLLGTADYGLYSVVAAAISIATVVGAEWIGQSVLRYLPELTAEHRARDLVADALGLSAAVTAVIALVAAFVRVTLGAGAAGTATALILPAATLLIAEIAFSVIGAVMQARLQSRALSVFRIAGAVLRLAMAAGFVVWVSRGVWWLLVGAAVGRGVAVIAAVPWVARHDGAWVRPRLGRTSLQRFAAYGVPMVGWTLGSQVLGLSDRFVIGAYHGAGPVGMYSASYNLVTMGFGLLAGPLLMAAHPLIVTAWRTHDRNRVPEIIASYSRLYLVAVVPILVVLTLCSRDVVSIVLSGEFRDGSRIIPVLVLGSFVWGFAMYGHKGLELAERTRLMFGLVAVCALVNIVLNLIFVPRYGYPAAAVTTLASNAVYPVLVHVASRRLIPWRIPWAAMVQVSAAGGVAGGVGLAVGRLLASTIVVVHLLAVSSAILLVYSLLVAGWLRARRRTAESES